MRNSEVVRAFKKRLVTEFRAMYNQLHAAPQISYADSLRLLAEKIEREEQLLLENKQQQQKITEDQPKV